MGTATIGIGSPVTVDMLDGWRTAGFDLRVDAALALLETLARKAAGTTPTDVAAERSPIPDNARSRGSEHPGGLARIAATGRFSSEAVLNTQGCR
jgi:hypothetical protein